jgi:hypothetical protein
LSLLLSSYLMLRFTKWIQGYLGSIEAGDWACSSSTGAPAAPSFGATVTFGRAVSYSN